MVDVVVVGARCAGASTALLLARAGYRVLLLDRARLPSDTLSTLYIHQPGVLRLARWGVLPAVGAPPITRALYRVGDVRLASSLPAIDGVDTAYAPRRRVLDWELAQAAVRAGAEFADGCSVVGLLGDGDRVTGVRFRLPGAREVSQRACLVVGADGMRSTVARLAGAAAYQEQPKLTCAYYTYWEGVPADFEQYESSGRWVGAMPTHDGLTLVAAYFPQALFDRVRCDALTWYLAAVRGTAPELAERLAGRRPADRLRGTGDQRNFLRRPAGPGWALVGDAGHHKDSITARGMTDAFAQAELLASCLTDGAGGRLPASELAPGLRRYAAQRDALVADGYRSTLAVGQLEVRPERLRMLRAIQSSAELTSRYFAAAAGILPAHDLFTPELVQAASPAAARPRSAAVAWRSPALSALGDL